MWLIFLYRFKKLKTNAETSLNFNSLIVFIITLCTDRMFRTDAYSTNEPLEHEHLRIPTPIITLACLSYYIVYIIRR